MRAIRSEIRSHRIPDLSVPQFRVLIFLNRREGASLSDVAEHMGLTLPSMSRMVDGLVARDLVTRQMHSNDRRRVALASTASGKAAMQSAYEATQSCLAERLSGLPASDLGTITKAMEVLGSIFVSGAEAGKISGR
jgi:MarR family transcriptional regulator for hemolysin